MHAGLFEWLVYESVPMPDKTGAQVGQTLTDFANDVGIPDTLVMDLAPEQAGKHTEMQTEAR